MEPHGLSEGKVLLEVPEMGSASKKPAEALHEAAAALQEAAVKLQDEKEEVAFGSPAAASPLASKVLDFGAKPTTPATPITPFPAKSADDEIIDYNEFIKSTVLWTHKVRSAIYLVAGLLLIFGVKQAFCSKTPFVTVACYLVLAQMGLNFIRAVANPHLQERSTYGDSAWTHWVIGQATAVIRAAAAVHDSHLMSLQPMKTLQIVVCMWLLSILPRYVSAFTLLGAVYALLFVLPKAYTTSKSKVDTVVTNVTTKAKAQFSKLDVRAKAALIVVPVVLLGYLCSSRADKFIAAFVVLAYGRTQFKQADVEARVKLVVDKTQFVTKTATKVGNTISSMVGTYADKYELTPTPSKKKSQ